MTNRTTLIVPPTSVTVCGRVIPIRVCDMKDRYAEYDYADKSINLDPSVLVSVDQMCHFLAHEVLHAVFDLTGLNEIPGLARFEEAIVTAVTNVGVPVIRGL